MAPTPPQAGPGDRTQDQIHDFPPEIVNQLKEGPEQRQVVGPLVEYLCSKGYTLEQIRFGKKERSLPLAGRLGAAGCGFLDGRAEAVSSRFLVLAWREGASSRAITVVAFRSCRCVYRFLFLF